jgi:hypothetical protein
MHILTIPGCLGTASGQSRPSDCPIHLIAQTVLRITSSSLNILKENCQIFSVTPGMKWKLRPVQFAMESAKKYFYRFSRHGQRRFNRWFSMMGSTTINKHTMKEGALWLTEKGRLRIFWPFHNCFLSDWSSLLRSLARFSLISSCYNRGELESSIEIGTMKSFSPMRAIT